MNIYSDPEAVGFELVDTLEKDRDYDFDMLIVLRNKDTGLLYVATDSGCSCPSPFEDTRVEDLEHITTIEQLERRISEWNGGKVQIDEVKGLTTKVASLLKKKVKSGRA